jgi:hypothetical protein
MYGQIHSSLENQAYSNESQCFAHRGHYAPAAVTCTRAADTQFLSTVAKVFAISANLRNLIDFEFLRETLKQLPLHIMTIVWARTGLFHA